MPDDAEWAKDGQFLWEAHPDGGYVEHGFYSIYRTMTFEAYQSGQFTGQKVPVAQVQSTRSNRSAADYPRTIPKRRPGHAGKTPLIHGSA